jgi:hypothetical protein
MYPDICSVFINGTAFRLSKEDYEAVEAKLSPKKKTVTKTAEALPEFLNELHKLTGGKTQVILTPQRYKKMTTLLQTMTREQLITAATHIGKDAFLQGDNENKKRYGDIDYLLRPDKAARWAEYNSNDKPKKMF